MLPGRTFIIEQYGIIQKLSVCLMLPDKSQLTLLFCFEFRVEIVFESLLSLW